MVAKISSGASLFGALSYNQEKVDKGVAKILFSQDIIRTVDGSFNIPVCMQSFESYLTANKKTENPVIHISLNSHPDMLFEIENVLLPTPKEVRFTFIDLFAGIGGFRTALQNLGRKCVFFSEWDEQAKNVQGKFWRNPVW